VLWGGQVRRTGVSPVSIFINLTRRLADWREFVLATILLKTRFLEF
jgi:hypothetical protein